MNGTAAKGTPLLAGWAIAAAAGLVAAAVAMVVRGFDFNQGAFVGIVICGVVGLILGFSFGEPAPAAGMAPRSLASTAASAAVVSPVAAPLAPAAAPAPTGVDAAPSVQSRPQALAAARDGAPDDLKLIKGIGPKLEQLCHSMGFYHFDQIAAWTPAEIAWVDDNLEGFKGRVTRDEWVLQARTLAAGGETEFSARTKDEA